ncbi:T-cell-specific surface glycoprotein CD28-like [Mastacembelus armatus]|uniref:T-cell-specific surface glycoprotein CD28-like n=1 Tax=Mastacembelus armatus TaxID=205130 RepID=UPI000E4545FE|nr:T-cell-specific surface glycoprotein CD28-like [Mastacembelus armatus]
MMRAGFLWMVMVCLSDKGAAACTVQPIVTVSKLSEVSVSCPSITPDSSELKFLLLFNNDYISQIQVNKRSESAESLFYGQFKVTANNSGTYVCRSEVLYPPPFRDDCHRTEVRVDGTTHGQNLTHRINATAQPANQTCPDRLTFIPEEVMWVGCGVLLVYSLSVTCIAIVMWKKQKTEDEETNVYENTRPRDFKKPYKV